MKEFKHWLWLAVLPALALVVLGAVSVTPGKRIKDYPHTNRAPDDAVFIMEHTNRAGPGPTATNLNISALELFQQGSNGLASVVSLNSASNVLFTNIVANSNAITATSNGLITVINFASNFLFISTSLTGTTNFMNFSAQAAKLPATNYPGIDGGSQNWEVLYYHTNAENAVANLSALWQFVVPPDYSTNSGKLHVQHTLIATNGPNSSNVVWTVDCVRSHSGDGVNLHTGSFGVQVHGTNTWAQSSTIVNAQTDLVINLNTNLMWQAGDLVLMRLTRNTANDTYRNTAVGLVGLQLEYTRQ